MIKVINYLGLMEVVGGRINNIKYITKYKQGLLRS